MFLTITGSAFMTGAGALIIGGLLLIMGGSILRDAWDDFYANCEEHAEEKREL